MTLLDDAALEDKWHAARPAAQLWQVLDGAGRGRFDVAAAPRGLERPVRGITIWDAMAPSRLAEGDLVLLTSAGAPLSRVLADARRAGATAVVAKGLPDRAAAGALAHDAGVALLLAADELCWDDVCQLARAVVPAGRIGDRVTAALGRTDAGRLFELAEAAAQLLAGPVVIADPQLRVLAYANLSYPVDELRTESIMGRRAPQEVRAWLASSGELAAVRHDRRARLITPPGADVRAVAPIISADAVAGYISLACTPDAACACTPDAGAGRAPLTAADLATLTDVATALAATVTPHPTLARGDEHGAAVVTADLLRGVLEGRGRLDVLAEHLGRPEDGWFLTCLRDARTHATSAALPATIVAGLAAMLRPGSTATVLDGDVLVLAPYTCPADARVLAECQRTRFGERAGRELVACLSDPFEARPDPEPDPETLCRTLRRAAALLATAVAGDPDTSRVQTAAQLRPQLILGELAELSRSHTSLNDGPLPILCKHDADRGTDFLGSLLAYFDAGCDVTEAAKRLHVHRNTLRYRLQRIEELAGTSLSAPLERFTLELQVRLHFVNS
jgi:hypothetical protein